jgi:Uma2 family endonuclease
MLQPNKKHTYADYLTWPDDERWEIIDGVPYMLAAPTWQHQSVSGQLMMQFGNYLSGKTCRAFSAPFDLRLPEGDEADEDVETVVQPDVTIVCDKSKLKGTGYYGVPALVIEIVSPATGKMDRLLKFNRYEKAGIKEYWIVDPDSKLVSVFTLQGNNRYGRPETYTDTDSVKVGAFPDLTITLSEVFIDL